MASSRGPLSRLTIATIFVVVIGTMYFGLQYSRGELVDGESTTPLEDDTRASLWERLNAARVEQGRDPARRESFVRVGAQDTAEWLVDAEYFARPTAVGIRQASGTLPNEQPLCHQVPAKYTVTAPGWNATATGRATGSNETTDAVAAAVAELFSREHIEVLAVPNDHTHGLGVAISGDVVYAVYRYCNLGY